MARIRYPQCRRGPSWPSKVRLCLPPHLPSPLITQHTLHEHFIHSLIHHTHSLTPVSLLVLCRANLFGRASDRTMIGFTTPIALPSSKWQATFRISLRVTLPGISLFLCFKSKVIETHKYTRFVYGAMLRIAKDYNFPLHNPLTASQRYISFSPPFFLAVSHTTTGWYLARIQDSWNPSMISILQAGWTFSLYLFPFFKTLCSELVVIETSNSIFNKVRIYQTKEIMMNHWHQSHINVEPLHHRER